MRTQRFAAILRLLFVLVLAVAVVAGPCQACFETPAKAPSHDCCPSKKSPAPHQHNSSCGDVQAAVDQSKSPLQEIAVLDAAPVVALPLADALEFAPFEPRLAVSHTPVLVISLRI